MSNRNNDARKRSCVAMISEARSLLTGAAKNLFCRIVAHTAWTASGVLAQIDEGLIVVYAGANGQGGVALLALVHGQVSQDGRSAAIVSLAKNGGWGCLPDLITRLDFAVEDDRDGLVEQIILWSPDGLPRVNGYEACRFAGLPALSRPVKQPKPDKAA